MIACDALLRLCPPPADPPPAVGWEQAERGPGQTLPADYKQLVETADQTLGNPYADAAGRACDLGPDARPLELN